MRTYSFGDETVPVAMAGNLVVGSAHDGHYKIMLAKIDREEIIETRFLAGENDWEGHSAVKLNDGYLIGGAVEGKASPDGGSGWKAYVARLDESLNVLWERKIEVRNNGAVYSILPAKDGIFIAGETGRPGNKGFFLGKVSMVGELLWLRDFGRWEDAVFTALLPGDGLKLIGSVKENGWKVKALEFTKDGEPLGEETLVEGVAFIACRWNGKLVLAGYRGENFWVRVGNADVVLGEGTATSLLPTGDKLIVGGELKGKAVLVEISEEEPKIRELWEDGWVEVLGENLTLGVRGGRWQSIHSITSDYSPLLPLSIKKTISESRVPTKTGRMRRRAEKPTDLGLRAMNVASQRAWTMIRGSILLKVRRYEVSTKDATSRDRFRPTKTWATQWSSVAPTRAPTQPKRSSREAKRRPLKSSSSGIPATRTKFMT